MSRKLKVELTEAQARALFALAGRGYDDITAEIEDHPDVPRAKDARLLRTGWRAMDAVLAALPDRSSS